MSGGKSGSGHRGMKERVKTARRRKPSSTRWLQRQLNDPYVARAKAEGLRSRAAFKLREINEKHRILTAGCRVVDLGAAPGGWSQYAAEVTGSTNENPLVVAIDYLEFDPIPGVVILKKDFLDEDAPQMLIDCLGGQKADLVMSDMAAPTTGHKATDHLRIMALCEAAAEFARDVLAPGGHFLAKIFRGGTEGDFLAGLKRDFEKIHHVKPPSSRSDSAEMYLLATGYRGAVDDG